MSTTCKKLTSLGEYLSSCRIENGKSPYWSLEEVAKRSGITKTYLYKIEKNYPTNVSIKVLKLLSLILQINYEKLLLLAGYIDNDNFTKKKALEVPILGEIRADQDHIELYSSKILESIATENIYREGKKLAAIKVKKPITINKETFGASDILIIPLSHIEIPIDEILILKRFK